MASFQTQFNQLCTSWGLETDEVKPVARLRSFHEVSCSIYQRDDTKQYIYIETENSWRDDRDDHFIWRYITENEKDELIAKDAGSLKSATSRLLPTTTLSTPLQPKPQMPVPNPLLVRMPGIAEPMEFTLDQVNEIISRQHSEIVKLTGWLSQTTKLDPSMFYLLDSGR